MVPGDFVSPSTDASNPAHLLRHLQEEVQQLRPIPTSRHGQQPSHVLDDVKTADHVFVPRNGHKGPLQLYSGPYRVLQSGDKMFRIDVGGCEDTVTVDRLGARTETTRNPLCLLDRRGTDDRQTLCHLNLLHLCRWTQPSFCH